MGISLTKMSTSPPVLRVCSSSCWWLFFLLFLGAGLRAQEALEPFSVFQENGVLMQGNRLYGKYHGQISYYDNNDNLTRTASFDNGLVQSEQYYYLGGQQIRREDVYDQGRLAKSVFYFLNGQVQQRAYFNPEKGSPTGIWQYFYANSQLKKEENWQLDAVARPWYFADSLQHPTLVDGNGFIAEKDHVTSAITSFYNYRDGLLEGEFYENFPDGKRKITGYYKANQRDSIWQIFRVL